jgi:hypothetical protein
MSGHAANSKEEMKRLASWVRFGLKNKLFVRWSDLEEGKTYDLYPGLEGRGALGLERWYVKKKDKKAETITIINKTIPDSSCSSFSEFEFEAYLYKGFVVTGSGADHMLIKDNLAEMPSPEGLFIVY